MMFKERILKNTLIILFLLITLLKINLSDDLKSESIIVLKAGKEGYDLTNSEDDFFLDICETFSYNNKDITLDYRQHYFFFAKKNKTITFQHPKRNNTNLCFWVYFELNHFFDNISFYFLFILFLFQTSLFSFIFFRSFDQPFYHTSLKKMEFQKKYKKKCFLCNNFNKKRKKQTKNAQKNFSEFTPETNIEQNSNITKKDNEKEIENETLKGLTVSQDINQIRTDELISYDNKGSSDSQQYMNKAIHFSISNTIDAVNRNIEESKATAKFVPYNNENIKDKNEDENDINNEELNNKINSKNINDNKEESYPEKSIDNYSFGNAKINFFFNNNNFKDEKIIINSKRNEENDRKKEEKLKKTEIIYKKINSKDINTNNNNIKNNNSSSIYPFHYNIKRNPENIQYSPEEYFYFGYLLARIKDKRSVFDIYFDLLEQCHIIFKLFFIPFNIYEDFKVQMIYYLLKLQLYFLFNCLLLKDSVINNIYDNKNFLMDDIFRSFLSCIYVYIIGLFLYYLSNIKRTLIKRRYKIENMRLSEQRVNLEIYKITYNICMDYLHNKIIIFLISLLFIFLYSFYICFSFCAVYKNTQLYILKGVFLSVFFSLISPFIFCWIPSFLRNKSLSYKNEKLYRFTKIIELLFIP